MCATCPPGTRGSQKRAPDPLELESEMVVSHHTGARNQPRVLCKNKSFFHNPENLDDKEDPERDAHRELIYMGSRKKQDLLSKLGAWGSLERVEREWGGREGNGENIYLNKNNKKE